MPSTPPAIVNAPAAAVTRAARVRLMVFDVDGVLTDGRLYFGSGGEALKAFHVRDGLGIKLLRDQSLATAILSARQSDIVAVRAHELGIDHLIQGSHDKAAALAGLADRLGLDVDTCGFIGDDWADLGAMAIAGFAAAPADAAREVQAAAHWVAGHDGGRGAVREVCEFVLRAQGRFEAALTTFTAAADAADGASEAVQTHRTLRRTHG